MKTNFDPVIHGYRFHNRFRKKLPNIFLKILFRDSVYGLCGGMIYSALDHYLLQAPVKTENKVIDLESDFIDYLWKRQFDSMPIKNYILLILKTLQSNHKLLQNTFTTQVPKIIESINRGTPAPIIIVRSKAIENPTNNHQVLLTNYVIMGPITEFACYDPNHPGQYTNLILNRIPGEESITQSTGESVRGFFMNNYKPKNNHLTFPSKLSIK